MILLLRTLLGLTRPPPHTGPHADFSLMVLLDELTQEEHCVKQVANKSNN